MICLKLATRTGSFQVEVDATPADCGVANINYERKPLAVPGTRNTGTNYADSRYQLPQIDNDDEVIALVRRTLPLIKSALNTVDPMWTNITEEAELSTKASSVLVIDSVVDRYQELLQEEFND